MRRISVFSPALPLLFCMPALCQEVISAHSGTVHFFEGAALLDDRPMERKAATFPSIPAGSTLRTEKGRAEVLLTPGVFLRIDENSAIRMVSNALADTQVEFLRGSAIIDSMEALGTPPIVLAYQHCRIRFLKNGIYRIDSDTGVLQAYTGQAQVAGPDSKTSVVDTAKLYFFDLGTLTNKFGELNEDEFYDWAKSRADAISAGNQLAAQSAGDATDNSGNPGMLTAPVPYYGTSPAYPAVDNGLGFGGLFFDPFLGLSAGAFTPYNVYPIFLVVRPGNWGSRWPHRNPTPGSVGSRPGLTPTPIRTLTFTPRPATAGNFRVYRAAPAVAPHPIAPAGIRAIHH